MCYNLKKEYFYKGQQIIGHADIDMTQHYLHVQSPIKQKAIQAFDKEFGVA